MSKLGPLGNCGAVEGIHAAQAAPVHRNAPLTPEGRLRLCHRIEDGWSVAAAAESMNISRQTAHKWWSRYRDEGGAGLVDRSSRPWSCPHQTSKRVERRIVALRQSRKLGPARLAGIIEVPPSTVHRVLVRHGLKRLRWMDRRPGGVIRFGEVMAVSDQTLTVNQLEVSAPAPTPDAAGHRVTRVYRPVDMERIAASVNGGHGRRSGRWTSRLGHRRHDRRSRGSHWRPCRGGTHLRHQLRFSV